MFSQETIKNGKDDLLIRSSYASFYIEETSESYFSSYSTPYGEACANIILKKFRDLLPLPEIINLSIDPKDRIMIEKLVS